MAEHLLDQIAEEMVAMERKCSDLEDANYEIMRDAQLHINDLVSQAMDARARSARWKRCAKRLRRQNLNQARRMGYVLLVGALGWLAAVGLIFFTFSGVSK